MRYSANLTAGSLKLPESRIIADLLLRGIDEGQWKDAIIKQNVLQARNPATAIRLARLILGSLEITFRVAGLDEIKRWILSFGPEAVVLEPEKFKEMVRKDLSESLTKYPVSHLSMKMEGLKSAFLMN